MDFLNYRPRSTFDDVRRPTEQEWAKWALMPQLLLWQAVALSCEIEPSSLPVEGVWCTAPAGTPASIFHDRFEVAMEHHRTGSLPSVADRSGFHSRVRVNADDFGRWAIRVGIALPSEIALMQGAPASAPAPAPEAMYRGLLSGELAIDALKAAWHQEQQKALAQEASDKGRALASKRHALNAHTRRVVQAWVAGKDFKSLAGAAREAAKYLATLPDVDPCKEDAIKGWLKEAGWKPAGRN